MKQNQQNLRTPLFAFGAVLVLLLLLGFQNCAPVMPLDGSVDSSSLSVRATATPGTGPGTIGGGGSYTGSTYDGTCTNDRTTDAMIVNGTDVGASGLIVFNNTDGRAAFWNISSGAVAHGTVCTIAAGWSVQATGDFNGDYNNDAIWRDTSGNVVIWLMRGSTRTATALLGTMPTTWQLEGAADFNLDGKADLVWRDATGNVKLWLMNGTSTPTETTPFAVPLTSHLLGTTDFDGDRRADLFWKNNDGSISLTTFDASLVPTTVAFPAGIYTGLTIVGFGDFSGDLKTDLLVTQNSDGNMKLRYMNGTALVTDSSLYAPANTAWTFQFTRDMNGDGMADWIWTTTSTTGTYLGFTPVSVTPSMTTFLPYPIQTGYSLFKYPHR